jgi:tripartite-type tricarboxylate transporter receptor subunit TctC
MILAIRLDTARAGAVSDWSTLMPEGQRMKRMGVCSTVGGIFALAALCFNSAAAQTWPDRPVTVVVPYTPGGNVDTAARVVANGLGAELGQPFVVNNRPGAGGLIGAEYVAKAKPDGYTLFFTPDGSLLFSTLILHRDAYDWRRDFIPIGAVSYTPLVLQVNPSLPVKSVADLIAMAKKDPGKLMMSTPGSGTTNHLVSELLQSLTDAHWTTVHYKGNAPATTDVMSGQVQFNFDQISVSLPFIRDGRLRALAVTSNKRVPDLPDVPTFEEAGIKGMQAGTTTGLFTPANVSADIVEKLSKALARVLKQKDVIDKFSAIGSQVPAMSPAEFSAYLNENDAKWTPIIKKAGIDAQ